MPEDGRSSHLVVVGSWAGGAPGALGDGLHPARGPTAPLRRGLERAPRRDPAGHERGGAGRGRRRPGVVQRIDVFRRTFGDGKPGGPEAFDKLGGTVPLDESGEEFPPGRTPQARAGRGEVFEMRVVAGEGTTRHMFEAGGRPIEGERIGSGVLVLRQVSEG